MKRKNTTRIIAIVLVLLMALALIPIAASAATPGADGHYTITLHSNYGTDQTQPYKSSDEDGGDGQEFQFPGAIFTRTDYTFVGWSDNPSATEGDDHYVQGSLIGIYPSTPVEYYAIWKHNDVTVTFYSNGGSGTMNPQTVAYNASVSIANGFTAPTGCSFAGWATSSTGEVAYTDTTLTLTEDLDLYAVWTYTVTLNAGGGTIDESASKTVTVRYPDSYTLPNSGLSYTGHIFNSWVDENNATATEASYLDAGKTFTAKWDKDVVTIKYDKNGGSGNNMDDAAVLRGKSYALEDCGFTAPSKKAFSCWKDQFGNEYDPGDAIDWGEIPAGTTEITMSAQWAQLWRVSFKPGTDGSVTPTYVDVKDGDALSSKLTAMPIPTTKSGYDFGGWFEDPSYSGSAITTAFKPESDQQLFAKWVSNNITFKFQPGTGASGEMSDGTAVRSSGKYTLPTTSSFIVPDTLWLAGWSIGGTPYELGEEYAIDNDTPEEVEVTALWDTKCTVTFKANGGTLTGEDTVYVAVGKTVPADSFPSVSRDGYTPLGWFDDTNTKFTSTYPVPDDMDVTAEWLNNTVEVTFDPNGGTGTAKKQNMSRTSADNLKALSELGFEKEGHDFKGWSLTAGGAKQFGNEELVTWNGDSGSNNYVPVPANTENPGAVTLYALWEEKLSGTVTIDNTTPKVGDTLTATPNVTPASDNLYYRWKVNGKVVDDADTQTFKVPPDAYGYPITVEVTNNSNFAYVIASTPTDNVDADESSLTTITVAFAKKTDDVNYEGYVVKVNGSPVTDGQNDIKVPKESTVFVTLESGTNTSAYVSKLQLGSTTIKDKNVAVVNPIKAPNSDTCTLTVTFAAAGGKTKTATIDPNADVSAATTDLTTMAKAALPAGYKDRYWVSASDVVACWDYKVTNPLKPGVEPAGEIPKDGLSFKLPYPAGSDFNSTVSNNMPKYYTITVYHFEGGTPTEISNVTPNKAFAAGVTVTGQKDFSDFGMTLTPKEPDGTVTLEGTVSSGKASVGAKLTAKYSKDVGGTLSYQWQYKDGSEWKPISGATKSDYTPTSADLNKTIRCVVTSDFETGKKESNEVTVVDKPNPSVIGNSKNILGIKGIIRGDIPDNTISYAVIGNVTSDMEWTGPSSSTPDSSATWKPTGGTSFTATEKGIYWVRTKDDTDSKNWGYVDVPIFYTINGLPGDSLSVNRIYYTSNKQDGVSVIKLSGHEWAVKENTSVVVTVHSANEKYYKLTKVVVYNLENGATTTKNLSKVNSYAISFSKINAPYRIYAWAGVYGAKTGDSSHLGLWVELAVVSLMGLSAAVVIGRKKKQK